MTNTTLPWPMMLEIDPSHTVLLRTEQGSTLEALEIKANELMSRDRDNGGVMLGPAQFTATAYGRDNDSLQYAAFWYVTFPDHD